MDRTELLSLDKDSEDYFSNSHNLYRKIHINEFKMWEDGKIHPAVFPKDKMMEGYSVDWSAVVNPLESFKMKTKSCPEGDRTLDTHGLLEISIDLFRKCREKNELPIRIKYTPELGKFINLAHSELQMKTDSKFVSHMRKHMVNHCKIIKWIDGFKPNIFYS